MNAATPTEASPDIIEFSFSVQLVNSYGPKETVHIVRSTTAMYWDSEDRMYSRRDGRLHGAAEPFDARWIGGEDLQAIDAFLAGRADVDIVAERKAGMTAPETIHGHLIIESTAYYTKPGLRATRVILVRRGEGDYVTAIHCAGDKSWGHGNYFADLGMAFSDYTKRAGEFVVGKTKVE